MQEGENEKDFQAIYVNSATTTLTFDAKNDAVQLLSAENEDFNNFADEFDNNMYHFEKADKTVPTTLVW